jgi:TonB family protein
MAHTLSIRQAPPVGRRWLVIVSIAVHAAIIGGVIVSDMWKIERLSPDRLGVEIASFQMPSDSGGGDFKESDKKKEERKKDKRPVEKLVQPTEPVDPPKEPETTTTDTTGDQTPGTPGNGTGGDGLGTGTPTCEQPPCGTDGPGKTGDDKPPVNDDRPPMVDPRVVAGLRISGETQIHPPDSTKAMILHEGKPMVRGTVRLCLDRGGRVTLAQMVGTSGYKDYDARLVAGVRSWRYRPYTVNGKAMPACSVVNFQYKIKN